MTRPIDTIVIHCSATPEGRDIGAAEIRKWHLDKGWHDIGYHFVVRLDGTVERGRPQEEIGAHVAGHNSGSLGICYVGGVDAQMNPKDTRTHQQKNTIRQLVKDLRDKYSAITKVCGHRDFPGVTKACPSFDVAAEL